MIEDFYSIKDVFLVPIYFALIFVIARQVQSNRIDVNPIYKYYVKGLTLKLLGGLSLCLIYLFYYKGGDTIGYYKSSTLLSQMLFVKPGPYFSVMAGNLTPQNLFQFADADLCCPDYYRDANSFSVVRFISPLVMVSGYSFFAATLLVAWLSYSGIWRLFLLFNKLYPGMEKRFAIAILYLPSLIFWGSGILKDTITFSAACWFTYCMYMLFREKASKVRYGLILLIVSYLLISLKPYIFVALLPGSVLLIFFNRIQKIGSPAIRLMVVPIMILVGLLGTSYIMSSLSEQLGDFSSVEKALDKAVLTKNDLTRDAYGENSFDIGTIDPSITGLLSKFPIAFVSGLFRPFLWEARNPVMIISGLENAFLLFLTLQVLFKAGPLRFFSIILSEPLLIFSLIFTVFFAFAVGLSTANFGALVRYKIPCIPFYLSMLFILKTKLESSGKLLEDDNPIDSKTLTDAPIQA
jgi:hypothetical protein